MELKVGDRVRGDYSMIGGLTNPPSPIYTGTVHSLDNSFGKGATIKRDDNAPGSGEIIPDYGMGWHIRQKADGTWGSNEDLGTLEIISESKSTESITIKNPITMATLLNKFTGLFATEPWKTFKKLGITNGDDVLTPEGRELYIQWAFKRDSEAFFKEVAAPILEEQEKEKKNA